MTRYLAIALTLSAISTSAPAQGPPKQRVWAVAYAPDGSRLAAANGEPKGPGRIVIWNADGRELHRLDVETGVTSLAFSPDRGQLAFAGQDGRVVLFDLAGGRVSQALQHPKEVLAVAFGPDGKLATAAGDRVVRVWNAVTGKELARTAEQKLPVVMLDISPDGKRIAGSDRRQAFVWDAVSGKLERTLGEPYASTSGVAFAEGGRFVLQVVGTDGSIVIHESATGQLRLRTSTHGGTSSAGFAPGVAVTSSSFDLARLTVIHLRLGEPSAIERARIEDLLRELDVDEIAIRERAGEQLLAFGTLAEPFLKRALAESPSAEVRLRSRKVREKLLSATAGTVTVPAGGVAGLAVSPDGKKVAVAGTDGAVRVIDLGTGKVLGTRWMAP
jgi:WD40 repeat protein